MLKVIIVALLPLAVSAILDLQGIAIYGRQDSSSGLDACTSNCVADAAIQASCQATDIDACICSNTQFQTDTLNCLNANCSTTDVSEVAQAFSSGCASLASQSLFGSETGSQTSSGTSTSTNTGSVVTGPGGATSTPSAGSSTNVAVIAGAAGGGGAALIIIIAGILTCVYCRKKKQRGPQYMDPMGTQDVASRPLTYTQPSFAPTTASAPAFDPAAGGGFAPHSPNNFDARPGNFVPSTSTFDSQPGGYVSAPSAYPAMMSIQPARPPSASTAFTGAYSSSTGPSMRPPSATSYTPSSPMPTTFATTPSPPPPPGAMPLSFAAPIAMPASAAAYSSGPSSAHPPPPQHYAAVGPPQQQYPAVGPSAPPAFAPPARDAHGYLVDSKQSRGQTVLAAAPGVTIPHDLLDRLNPSQRGIVEGLLARGDVGSDAVVDVVRRMLAENEARDDEPSGLPSYGA